MKTIIQFSYRLDGGPPKGVPVIDCRGITNPYRLSETDEGRAALVRAHEAFPVLVETGVEMLGIQDEIAVGCEWGRHRSGTVAREISSRTGAKIARKPKD
jgi:hypothetical protein